MNVTVYFTNKQNKKKVGYRVRLLIKTAIEKQLFLCGIHSKKLAEKAIDQQTV